ncbi:WD40/YVTN/BNR-like repeat-containing protein [Streptomyces lasiicapitis]|uniref:WD40/YVTN/BNR-like repeat-containing protein n=1 Tax=Streptomyces lasiicapitis TaxID=1923961 RepID=UPI003655B1F5
MARRLLVAALAVAMTLVAVMSSAAAEAPSWQHVPVPAEVRPQAGLNEAVAFGPDRAWAVGADAVGRQAPGFPLVLRWDGTAWKRQSLPGIRWQGELLSVAATSPTAVWAVGRDSAGGTRLLRHDGKAWTESPPPSGVALTRVAAGGGETWLIGSRAGAQVLLRRDGSGWQDMPVPPGYVYGLHVKAADDVWAAGATDSGAAVSHWNGQAWEQKIVDGFPRSGVSSVLAVSPTEVWAGGTAGFVGGPPGRPIPPLLVRFDGQAWNRVTVPADFGSITSLAPDSSGALGWVSVARSLKWAPPGSNPPLIPGPDFLAWNGQSFAEHSEPVVAGEGDSSTLRLAPVPGSETVWSVGRAAGPEGTFAPRILRFGNNPGNSPGNSPGINK